VGSDIIPNMSDASVNNIAISNLGSLEHARELMPRRSALKFVLQVYPSIPNNNDNNN
jgi:hypothetical protein